jgi:eukaryotic-like serine/threonine-protein kinase
MAEPNPEETLPLDRPGSSTPTVPVDAEPAMIRLASTETATVAPRSKGADTQALEVSGQELTVSFVVARGQGATRSYVAPEGVSRVRNSFTPGIMLQGRYQLGRELGRGGMGVVYLGQDVRLDRPVAIKAILATASGTIDESQRDAFAEEARLGANLTHPAIATVYDYGFHQGSPFAVFEFIPGLTLRDVLAKRHRLPLDEVRLIVGALAQALDFAHDRHVVHRDLKPENIRATEQGQFKILDLGLAQDFHNHADWTFCGTPAYASPEQASAQPCDGRTDQYALAVIAFEMLTGQKTFESRDWITLLDKHAHEPPPHARSLQPEIPDSVDAALDKALSKPPEQRFATCAEFATAMGCQLLSAPARDVQVLLETTASKLRGRWRSFNAPFILVINPPRAYLAMAPDALWATYRGMLMRWPLGTIAQASRSGRWLRLRLDVNQGKSVQWFKLARRKDCQEWVERLQGLIGDRRDEQDRQTSTQWVWAEPEALGEPGPDPVVLLETRPTTRFQLLGPVEVKTTKRKLALPALGIRGAMMGVDAIVDVRQDRLAATSLIEYHASGTAVRAVDREGRLELKARWFDSQARSLRGGLLALTMMGMAGFHMGTSPRFTVNFQTVKYPIFPYSELFTAAGGFLVFVLVVAFCWLRWPQLARPLAICLLGSAISWVASFIASMIGAFATGSAWIGSGLILLTIVTAVLCFSVFSFYNYLRRRTLAIDRAYRQIIAEDSAPIATSRRLVGGLALGFSVAYAALIITASSWSSFQNVSHFPSQMAKFRTLPARRNAGNPASRPTQIKLYRKPAGAPAAPRP